MPRRAGLQLSAWRVMTGAANGSEWLATSEGDSMRAVVQRVHEAWVLSAADRNTPGEEVGRIGSGLVAFVGATHGDQPADAHKLADRIATLRIFPDDAGSMNLSCQDVAGSVLVISQFTVYADTRKGRRPSYVAAAAPDVAEPLVDDVADRLRFQGLVVATGRFQTHMDVGVINDGPVTITLEV